MSATARPPAPIDATFTVSLGGVCPLPATSRRGRIVNSVAPAALCRNVLRFIFISLNLCLGENRDKLYHNCRVKGTSLRQHVNRWPEA